MYYYAAIRQPSRGHAGPALCRRRPAEAILQSPPSILPVGLSDLPVYGASSFIARQPEDARLRCHGATRLVMAEPAAYARRNASLRVDDFLAAAAFAEKEPIALSPAGMRGYGQAHRRVSFTARPLRLGSVESAIQPQRRPRRRRASRRYAGDIAAEVRPLGRKIRHRDCTQCRCRDRAVAPGHMHERVAWLPITYLSGDQPAPGLR